MGCKTGKNLNKFNGHSNFVNCVVFSPDNLKIVSGSDDDTVIIWDANTGQKLNQLKGHSEWIKSVAFSPDNQKIVSGSDNNIIIWDANTGQILNKINNHTHWVSSVGFSNKIDDKINEKLIVFLKNNQNIF